MPTQPCARGGIRRGECLAQEFDEQQEGNQVAAANTASFRDDRRPVCPAGGAQCTGTLVWINFNCRPTFLPGLQASPQEFSTFVGAFLEIEISPARDRPGRDVGQALQAQDRGTGQQTKNDENRGRVPRQSEQWRVIDATEGHGFTGFDGQTPQFDPAKFGNDVAHVVFFAYRHAPCCQHQI